MVMEKENAVSVELKEKVDYIRRRYITKAKQNGDGFVVLDPWEKFDEDMIKYFENIGYTIVQRKNGCMIVWNPVWEMIFRKDVKKKKRIYKISIKIFLASILLLLYQLYVGIDSKENMIIVIGIFYTGVLALVHCAIQYNDKIYITPKEP